MPIAADAGDRSPSARSIAIPRQMPTSSVEWCPSTCRSPLHVDGQVDHRVPREQLEHVVEEADAGSEIDRPFAVQIQGQVDLGFARLPVNLGSAAGL